VRVESRPGGADTGVMDRRVIWLFVVAGSTLGGFAPEAWGGSAFGVASLGLACLGGIAGVWFAVRLTG
jgi:hypothetical protein